MLFKHVHFPITQDEQLSEKKTDKSSSIRDEGSDVDFVQEDGEVPPQTVEEDVSEVLLADQGGR